MRSNRWTAYDLPDLTGRTVMVTGASSGIGIPTTRELARAVLAVRNVAKGEEIARTAGGRTEVRQLELTDLASIRAFRAPLGAVGQAHRRGLAGAECGLSRR